MKRVEIVELLEKMSMNAYRMSEIDKERANEYMAQSSAYDEAIFLLTDNEYAKTIRNIYSKREVAGA